MILYYFSLKMEGNKIKSLAKSQYDTLLLADKIRGRVINCHTK